MENSFMYLSQCGLEWFVEGFCVPSDSSDFFWFITVVIGSSVIYFLITLYVDEVNRDKFSMLMHRNRYESFEDTNPDHRVAVKVIGLSKISGKQTLDKNLCFNLSVDEITMLLGRNGAGKSTAISMLVGLTAPSTRTAVINEFDIRTNRVKARASIG